MWPEVTEARSFFHLGYKGASGFFPFFLKAKHTYAYMCIQLLQKGHMKEIPTDATVFFVSSIFCQAHGIFTHF